MLPDIYSKLNDHFASFENSAIAEKDVIYTLVEVRKIIESTGSENEFKILKFHADWAIHNKKSRSLDVILPILQKLNEYDNPMEFAEKLLDQLNLEMRKCCEKYKLRDITTYPTIWSYFKNRLIEILIDQPIVWDSTNSPRGVIKFSYSKSNNGTFVVYFNIQ